MSLLYLWQVDAPREATNRGPRIVAGQIRSEPAPSLDTHTMAMMALDCAHASLWNMVSRTICHRIYDVYYKTGILLLCVGCGLFNQSPLLLPFSLCYLVCCLFGFILYSTTLI